MQEGADPEQERGRLEQERQRATNAYVAGALGEPQWRQLLARVERELAQLLFGTVDGDERGDDAEVVRGGVGWDGAE